LEPFDAPTVMTVSARECFDAVLKGAGATLPTRDTVDSRIVNEVRQGTGRIIDSQKQVGGWPVYRSVPPPEDADRDGMPDLWESSHALDSRNPGDAASDRDGDGYSNIEEYLNQLTQTTLPVVRTPVKRAPVK
jgi:hypothetical protein